MTRTTSALQQQISNDEQHHIEKSNLASEFIYAWKVHANKKVTHDLQLYHSVVIWEITIFNYQWYITDMERLMVNVRWKDGKYLLKIYCHTLQQLFILWFLLGFFSHYHQPNKPKIVRFSCLKQSRSTMYFICILLMIWIWIERKYRYLLHKNLNIPIPL